MKSMFENRRTITIAAAAGLLVVACGSGLIRPSHQRMAMDVLRLADVLPLVEELRVTDFENNARCRIVAYARGSFGDGDDGCERDGTVAFDAVALADHRRLSRAVEASGVAFDRILVATHRPGIGLETAYFVLNDAPFLDYWEYLYDPTGVVPKRDDPGRREFTRIDDDWWFVWSPDD
jgi:hypothetical protein